MFGWLLRRKPSVDPMAAYARLMEENPSSILDIAALPIRKGKMKGLLKAAILSAREATDHDAAVLAYRFLSHFQKDIGGSPLEPAQLKDRSIAADHTAVGQYLVAVARMQAESEQLSAEIPKLVDRAAKRLG